MSQDVTREPVINVEEALELEDLEGEHYGARYKILTPSMRPRGGSLGVNYLRVPPGRTACPFHAHQREDEVFFVLSGRGTLRYGDQLRSLRAGDCVSCPAGTGIAHQIFNDSDEELVYLAIGPYDPHEVCTYPDSDKVLVRSLGAVGRLTETAYTDGEDGRPRVLELIEQRDEE